MMQPVRFALIGGLVAIAYVTLYLGLLFLGVPQVVANGAAFVCAVGLQYFGQAGFTFRRRINDRAQMLRFVAMIGLGLMTAALITGPVARASGLADGLAALIVILVLPVQNYAFMTLWVFSKSDRAMGQRHDTCL